MPAEAIVPVPPAFNGGLIYGAAGKCSHCGENAASLCATPQMGLLAEEGGSERVCGACKRTEREIAVHSEGAREEFGDIGGIGLGLRGMTVDNAPLPTLPSVEEVLQEDRSPSPSSDSGSSPITTYAHALPIPSSTPPSTATTVGAGPLHASSLPAQSTRPWIRAPVRAEKERLTPPPARKEDDRPPNPLLDVSSSRVSNVGRGALHAGSIFRGTQTSGRSAYDVEIRFLDVNFPESSVSGYLSISHLTDTHPHLTTFFTGEIIGPKYGFITGTRLGATEHDDMRHWGRFEQFRRPATRADMIRPELLFRDPLPDRTRMAMGETEGKERDFVFLRIKERFLVPDHTVRDISGASFAGFYFAMIDLAPTAASADCPPTPASPTIPKSPLASSSPTNSYFPTSIPASSSSPSIQRRQSMNMPAPVPPSPVASVARSPTRRMSSSAAGAAAGAGPRSPSAETGGTPIRRRRESSGKLGGMEREVQRDATLRGYYFHSLNQEPFQELFLTHVPNKSVGSFEIR